MKVLYMKKTPSALKWLAEKRARVAHDLAQTERIVAGLTERLEALRVDLAALDRTLGIYDPSIDPDAIGSVNGWQGKAGHRGALRGTVLKVLEDHAPDWVSTVNVEALVTMNLGLFFELPELRSHWYAGSFRSTLKKLVLSGLVEKDDDSGLPNGMVRWRLKQEKVRTLAELREGSPA